MSFAAEPTRRSAFRAYWWESRWRRIVLVHPALSVVCVALAVVTLNLLPNSTIPTLAPELIIFCGCACLGVVATVVMVSRDRALSVVDRIALSLAGLICTVIALYVALVVFILVAGSACGTRCND